MFVGVIYGDDFDKVCCFVEKFWNLWVFVGEKFVFDMYVLILVIS